MTDSPFPPGAQLRAYLRDSGGRRQHLSIGQQEAEIQAWCQARAYQLTYVYKDQATSAKNGLVGREQFQAMVAYFQAGGTPERGLLLWDLTRWAREVRSGLRSFLDLESAGVRVYPISEVIPDGPFGLMYVILKFSSAEDENRRKSTDVQRGLRRLMMDHRGLPSAAALPFGYRRVPAEIGTHYDGRPHVISRLEPDPETAHLVRKAFEMAAAGHSLPEIVQATGLYRGPSGMGGMLANPIYVGEYHYGGTVNPDFCPPIVERELWERAQQARQAARTRHGWAHPRAAASAFLLSGMIRCGKCDKPMVGNNAHGHRYYLCRNQGILVEPGQACSPVAFDAIHLEARVIARLQEALGNPALLAALHEQQIKARPVDDTSERIQARRAELAQIETRLARATDALLDRPKSPALLARLDELEAAQAQARQALAELEASRPPAPLSLDSLEALRRALLARLDGADFRTQQLTLRNLQCQVVVARNGRKTTMYAGRATFNLGVVISVELP